MRTMSGKIKAGFGIACLLLILLATAGPVWALEPVGPESEAMLQKLRGQSGKEPTAEGLVDALNRATVGFLQPGEYAQAEIVASEALALAERDLGQEHQKTLAALNNLAVLLNNQGRYDEAEPLYLRALKSHERILGEDHPDTLTSLSNLAELYRRQGRYDEAEPLSIRAHKTHERILGRDHPDTLVSVNNLAMLYYAQGRYDEAESFFVHALETHERILGKDHPNTLTNTNNLAGLYYAQGRYEEAEPLLVRALEASERILGQDHPQTLGSVNNLAELYRTQGRYDEAELLLVRALKARRQVLGRNHSDTLTAVNNLARLYESQGYYPKAEQLYMQALEDRERILGQDHPQTLSSVNGLAVLYQTQGRYGKSELLYLRALEAQERVLGKDHPDTIISVINLADLYRVQGRYGEAELLYLRALETNKRVLGWNHPDTLISVNNLAGLYKSQGRYDEAKPLYLRTLEAHERILGQDHPHTLVSINNLAGLHRVQGRYDKAEPLYLRTLAARERILGQGHPDTLLSINNLAGLYESQGRYGKAEPLYVRAIETGKRVLGEDHPLTLNIQLNLAVALIGSGQRDRALGELRRVDEGLRGFVGAQLDTTLSERIRRGWLLSESRFQDVVFSFALQHPEPDTLRLAADVLLRWKRLAEGSESLTARFVRSTKDPKTKETAEKLAKRRSALSRLVNLQAPDDGNKSAAHANAIALAIKDIGHLEVELAGLSEEFRDHQASLDVDWEQVRSGLPKGSALLSLRAFSPVDFATGNSGEPHWLALVIPAEPGTGAEILLKDLGPIAPTESTRKALRKTGNKESARTLYQRLFGELDAELAKYDRLYIAPDGALDLVPFARLILPNGRYWIERQALHRIQTGRDLVASGSDSASAAGMVAYGGVDYGETDCPEPKSSSTAKRSGIPSLTSDAVAGDRMLAMNRRLRGEGHCFDPLPFTAHEAKSVADFYWDSDNRKAEIWRNRDASEDRLKSLESPPRILHLATHGFFLDRKSGSSERPLTLAGVALAGANDGLYGKTGPAGEDGILYALETLDLNLAGTELVALSACDTGRGEVDYSEGVYGLVRAFRIAGARHVLMTLWPLNDRLAYSFMKDFYAKWFDDPKRHPAEVLREIQLAWIRSKDPKDPKALKRSDPKYWAPYVLIEGR